MSEAEGPGVLIALLKSGDAKILYKKWPAWLGGLLIGITSVITFAWVRPWGVSLDRYPYRLDHAALLSCHFLE